jgi:colicin import membrane protein
VARVESIDTAASVCYRSPVQARALLALAIAVASPALLPSATARADGGELVNASRPPAPPGEGATAEKLLQEIEARAARDAGTAKVVSAAVENAKTALERAHGARTANDPVHGHMLDGLALEWAQTARDLERAAAAEQSALVAAKAAADATTQADRARSLLEETQARRQRAEAELAKAEADAKEAAKAAATAEQDRIEAAKKGGKAAPPKGISKKTPAAAEPKKAAPKGKKGAK